MSGMTCVSFDRSVFRCGCVAIAVALSACAQGGPLSKISETERIFVEAAMTRDLNKDGAVTCDEWKSYAGGLFRDADVNHDGQLSREEYQRISSIDRLFQVAGFEHFDADRNGQVTLQELTEKPNPAFVLMDKNKDCRLTQDEIRSPTGAPSVARGPDAGGPQPGTGGPPRR